MNIQFLDKAKKKKILTLLEEQYGILKLSYLIIQAGKGKYRIYSGSLSKEELNELAKDIHIELIGSKLCKIDNEKLRLNFDTINLPEIKSQISKNTLEISENKIDEWLKGKDFEDGKQHEVEYLVIKHKKDLLGIGKPNKTIKNLIQNYVPKERRIKN